MEGMLTSASLGGMGGIRGEYFSSHNDLVTNTVVFFLLHIPLDSSEKTNY